MKSSHIHKASLLAGEIITGAVFSLVSLTIFVKLASEVFQNEVSVFDNQVMADLIRLRSDDLTSFFTFITRFGGLWILGLCVILTIGIVWLRHNKEALLLLPAISVGLILNIVIKDIYQKPRPGIAPLIIENSYSFPSGHAMNACVFYFLVAYYLINHQKKSKVKIVIAGVAVGIVFLVGLSRVYLGVHYPTDVLAGYLAGITWLITLFIFDKGYEYLKLRRGD